MKLVQFVLRRPTSVVLLILAVVVFGAAAMTGMPLEYMPDMEMPMELVMLTWPGADADSIDRLVVQPVEEECETLSGIDSVNSYTFDNYTMIQLTYKYGSDMDDVYMDLKSTMDNLMGDLPEDCEDPMIMELSADFLPTLNLSVTAPEGMNVSEYLNNTVVPALQSVSGVAMVEVSGAQEEYIRIVLNEAAMQQYGLSIQAVGSAIAAADFDMPVGSVTMGTQDITLGAYGNVEVGTDFRTIPIQTPSGQIVRLDDVATFLNLYREEADSVSRYNGQDSVLLNVTKQDSAATIAVCSDVMKLLNQYTAEGLTFRTIYSEADSILETLSEVLKTLITGVILTMLVLLLFFGDLRASFVVAISMPLSILLAVILLNFAGYNIDLMTGTALIIAIGMIVDNSIVILESCARAQEEGLDYHDAAVRGTSTMLMSILAGTLTTIVVYIPLAIAEGMTGMMSAPLSWTILLTMLSSFLSAVVVVPLTFVKFKPKPKAELPINRLLAAVRAFYRRVMPGVLRRPGRVVFLGMACFAASLLLLTQMEFVLIPDNYDGSISMTAAFRSGTKLEVMDESVQVLEEALLADTSFSDVTLSISENTATFTAYAAKGSRRTSEEAVELYTSRFSDIPGMDVTVSPASSGEDMSSMMSSGNTKEITLVSDDMAPLEEGAGLVQEAMAQIPGVIKLENSFDQSRIKGRLVVNSQKALGIGTSEAAVAMQIYYILNGMTAATVDYGDTEYDIILEYPAGKYDDITALMDYAILTQSGRQVTLGDIAEVEYITTLPTITRQKGQYSATITATTTDAAQYTAANAIDAAVDALALPAGVARGTGMLDTTTDQEVKHITQALLSAIFLVFLV
ncbi:MAG: efflux RND transporter permease subunit, partial [Oscillospiraceae bacterium]|nr:efflux RND transporter permease subunit [Oscillospiraceae bacterium]